LIVRKSLAIESPSILPALPSLESSAGAPLGLGELQGMFTRWPRATEQLMGFVMQQVPGAEG
jgi:hypothetical protein